MKILLKGADGSVAIMTLADGANKEETVRKFKECYEEGFYVDYFEFDGEVPKKRDFRDAWTLKGNKVCVDENKAKGIHLHRVRIVRNLELEKLDKEHLRYLSVPDKLLEIEEKKQNLRDLPSKIKNLDWPDELPC